MPAETLPDTFVHPAGYCQNVLSTGRCVVPNLRGKTLVGAKRTLVRADCRVGQVRRAFSKVLKKGRVVSQKPWWGAVLAKGGKVNVVVSRGRRR